MANIHLTNVPDIAPADAITNDSIIDVIGNKVDASDASVGTASLIALMRHIIANLSTDADVAALLGALNTTAATGAVDVATTIMGYLKQVVTEGIARDTAIGIIDTFHDVAIADAVDNAVISDVTGNKADAAATGAVSAVESLMAYCKQLVTEGIARDIAITAIGTAHDVATPDAVTNTVLSDVVGNKADAAATGTVTATESLVAYLKQLVTEGIARDVVIDTEALKTTAGLPQMATVVSVDGSVTPWTVAAHRLFTVTGVVKIHEIFAVVTETVVEGAGADNTISIGISDDVDLMIGVTAGDSLVTNDIWSAVAGNSLPNHTLLANAESFIVNTTDIDINVLGTNSIVNGTVAFYCTWTPISLGATLVAAIWD